MVAPRIVQKISDLPAATLPLDPDAVVAVTVFDENGIPIDTRKVRLGDLPLSIGPEGPVGPRGPQGLTGLDGPQGLQGVPGPQGSAGPKGDQGDDGPAGPTGPQGVQGETGGQGPQGDQGLSYLPSAIEPFANRLNYDSQAAGFGFLASDEGKIYFRIGAAGNWSSGVLFGKGDQGVKGDTGDQGVPGNTGATGAQGPQGNIGPPGVQGGQGPQGAQGPQGITGLQGPEGPAGTAGFGIPSGGLEGQVLVKTGPEDYDVAWVYLSNAVTSGGAAIFSNPANAPIMAAIIMAADL